MSLVKRGAFAAAAIGLIGSSTASATETITYTYDARGRVVKVVKTGTVNNNTQTCYKVDKAGNRTNVKTDVGSLPACP
jgi:YD repeat-containing protein